MPVDMRFSRLEKRSVLLLLLTSAPSSNSFIEALVIFCLYYLHSFSNSACCSIKFMHHSYD